MEESSDEKNIVYYASSYYVVELHIHTGIRHEQC